MKTREELEHQVSMLNVQVKNAIFEIERLSSENQELKMIVIKEGEKMKVLTGNNVISSSILGQQLNKYNAENQRLLERIDFLTKKLKEYGYNDQLEYESHQHSSS